MSNVAVIPEFKFDASPAKINFNFGEIDAALTEYLEKYKGAVVTNETLASDKKLVSQLNAEAKRINDLRISQKKKLSEPITAFEESMKALHSKYKEVSDGINEQVEAHEQVRLDKCEKMISELLEKTRSEHGVDSKHMLELEAKLVLLGSLTQKDALTKSAKDAIENHVKREVAFMQQTEKRLLMLENASLKAGLDAPLTRGNVEAFLYDDEDGYQIGLAGLIDSELERQEVARKANEERIKKEQEDEAQKKAEAQLDEKQVHEEIKQHYSGQPVIGVNIPESTHAKFDNGNAAPQSQTITNEDGTITRTVVAKFKVTTKDHITDEQVINKLQSVMSSAGITTLQSIEVI